MSNSDTDSQNGVFDPMANMENNLASLKGRTRTNYQRNSVSKGGKGNSMYKRT